MENDTIWLGSFDIGKLCFAFYIEEISLKELKSIKNIPKDKRHNIDGTCTSEFTKLIKKVCNNGKRILLDNVDLTSGDIDKSKYFDLNWCHNMINLLDKYIEYWDHVDYFIIEQQMSFGKRNNTMALKLGQNCASYFMFKYGRFKKVIEFSAYHKTQVLGAPRVQKKLKSGKIKYGSADKPKKWSITKAVEILTDRGDTETLDELMTITKKKKIKKKKGVITDNDKCDCIVQLQAFKYLYFVEQMKF